MFNCGSVYKYKVKINYVVNGDASANCQVLTDYIG